MLRLKLIMIFCLNLNSVSTHSQLAATHLMVVHAGPCDDDADSLVSIKELSILQQNYDCAFSGSVNLTEDIENGWKVKGTMQKCADIRNTETCDFFKTFYVVRDGCSGNDDEYQDTYNMFFHYTNPEMNCPLRAGSYEIINFPIFTEDNYMTVTEAKISTSIFGYTFNLEGYTVNERRIFCVEAHLQLLYMRDHNWLENKNKSKINNKDN